MAGRVFSASISSSNCSSLSMFGVYSDGKSMYVEQLIGCELCCLFDLSVHGF